MFFGNFSPLREGCKASGELKKNLNFDQVSISLAVVMLISEICNCKLRLALEKLQLF